MHGSQATTPKNTTILNLNTEHAWAYKLNENAHKADIPETSLDISFCTRYVVFTINHNRGQDIMLKQ